MAEIFDFYYRLSHEEAEVYFFKAWRAGVSKIRFDGDGFFGPKRPHSARHVSDLEPSLERFRREFCRLSTTEQLLAGGMLSFYNAQFAMELMVKECVNPTPAVILDLGREWQKVLIVLALTYRPGAIGHFAPPRGR